MSPHRSGRMPEMAINNWRQEFVEMDGEIDVDRALRIMAASGWAKEFAIVIGGVWLFGSTAALAGLKTTCFRRFRQR
jgi:hypothetical protein